MTMTEIHHGGQHVRPRQSQLPAPVFFSFSTFPEQLCHTSVVMSIQIEPAGAVADGVDLGADKRCGSLGQKRFDRMRCPGFTVHSIVAIIVHNDASFPVGDPVSSNPQLFDARSPLFHRNDGREISSQVSERPHKQLRIIGRQ